MKNRRINPKQLLRIAILLSLLLVLAGESYLTLQLKSNISKAQEEIEAYQATLKRSQKVAKRLKDLQRKLSIYKRRIRTFSSDALGLAYVQNQLSSIANKNKVDISNVSILTTRDWKYGIEVTTISSTIKGSVPGVFGFLSSLEDLTDTSSYVIKRTSVRESSYRKGDTFQYRALSICKLVLVWKRGEK